MNSRQTQCDSILHRLRQGPATTLQLGFALNICSVTKRISELRRSGHVITSTEKRNGLKRVVTYRLSGDSNPTDKPAPRLEWPLCIGEHVTLLGERVAGCCNCGGLVNRKRKARPRLGDEHVFCCDWCRDHFWNKQRKSRTDSHSVAQGNPQLLPMNGDGA